MKRKFGRIDKVRASRDGHEFHEAWAARKALQLVMPTHGLVGIAVEGLAPEDQDSASAATVEIADLVFYYGEHPTFEGSRSIVITQVKYSKGAESLAFRTSDAKKTISKFASAYKNYKRNHDVIDVEDKLAFELVTNRPVYSPFSEAIAGLASGILLKGEAKKQATQFISACGFTGDELAQFARKVGITGLAGSLRQNKEQLSRVLADWSAAPDAMARIRLSGMRHLLREKAGLAGQGRNVIVRTDVLDALELHSPDDLLPCPASFPEIGRVVAREQLVAVVKKIPELDKPLLIHADGGVGKTVFLQSLSKALSGSHETVLFDCFGGGAYRAPEDARHLPKRGLIHIINKLACDGLCDPLLPMNENVEGLVKAFRTRLEQAVATLRRGSSDRQLLLFIDAIDNAAEHAKDKDEKAFPKLILESFHYSGPIAGVQLIVSCRTHRREVSKGDIPCEEIKLQPFSTTETEKYLRDRIPKVTDAQIHVAYSRSEGNPRILEHLALSDRNLLDPSESKNVIKLDDLLKARIRKALDEALKRGYKGPDINAFLAGLSVLPPPVPLEDYADAHDIELGAVKSFAADLAPLLEQTRHGLMFRDEPTETLVREVYVTNEDTLRTLAGNLLKKQGTSVYAASALPSLLQKLDDGKLLFELAFDDRFPSAITSTVGKQNIRYARLKAAVLHASRKMDFYHLVHLLVELSTLAAVNQRGTDYILDNPDLVIASHDIDATRRLFETRTSWPGTRHARLTIASILSGDLSDAYRHAAHADEWIHHFYNQDEEYRRNRSGPERMDLASIPFCLVAHGRTSDAARFMNGWKDWYAYEVAAHIFTLLRQTQIMETIPVENVPKFLDALKSQPGMLAAALSFLELDDVERQALIKNLAAACKKKKAIETHKYFSREKDYLVQDGLLKASAIAFSMSLDSEALAIVSAIPHERPRLWSFTDRFSNKDAFPFITYTALRAAVEQEVLSEHALLPQELVEVGSRITKGSSGVNFRQALKAELEECYKAQQGFPNEKMQMSHDTKSDAEGFINERLEPLLEIAQAFTETLSSRVGKGDKSFLHLIEVWTKVRRKRERYSNTNETNLFFDMLGRQFLIFSLWARSDLKASTVEAFMRKVSESKTVPVSTLVEIVALLSKRPELRELAGTTALKAKTLIEHEDEVDHRASLFAQLSRAIMPASLEEAAVYFRAGLEQMDVIGSGDYEFTNELLLFAAGLKGSELDEAEFHMLSNICELNMPSEEEKFPWLAFARALSRTSGMRTLAKLGRWDDRDKISLNYTLLPYLTALIEQDKIDPAIALAVLRISDPAELYVCGTEQLASVIEKKHYPNSKELIAELILQFEQNHPGIFMPDAFATLSEIAQRELGKDSEQSKYFSAVALKSRELRDENNDHRNYLGTPDHRLVEKETDTQEENRHSFKKIKDETDPSNEDSMSRAIDALNDMQNIHDLKVEFFDALRAKLRFAERSKYVQIIARCENLNIYTKLRELKTCKEQWRNSSASIDDVFHSIGSLLIQINADDFISYSYSLDSHLKETAELSGVPLPTLALELIAIFSAPDAHLPAFIWMKLAVIICQQTKDGEGQLALMRLLRGNAAKLASTVVDGKWKDGMYPKGEQVDIAAGLVWLTLGSPYAASRWRSAHSIRCFARFGKWDVIDAIVSKFYSIDAHPYQAPELPFYFLHARLWLLIAIARTSIDHPENIAKYADMLKAVALDKDEPHVLMRHFAAQALLNCAEGGSLVIKPLEVKQLKAINLSPFPIRQTKEYASDSFYQSRPDSMPKPESEFNLDYDFDKTDVQSVSNIFDRSGWEAKDAITARVRKYDEQVTTMYESGGRSIPQRNHLYGMNSRYHTYGQQLGWHALYLVAGEFLRTHSVVHRPYDNENSWDEWLVCELLTRKDGLWLADGIDKQPFATQVNLQEKGEKDIILTGDRKKLLALLDIDSIITENLVVGGDWHSADGIEIHISSALVPSCRAKNLAIELSKEDAFEAWLPRMREDGEGNEYLGSKKEPFKSWIVWPSTDTMLDGTDPLGAASVMWRPRFTEAINAIAGIKAPDPFKRIWMNADGRVTARSEAWGRNRVQDEDRSISGQRLVCDPEFLKNVLVKEHTELLVLIILRRYDKGHRDCEARYFHTTAVVLISQSLEFEYYAGKINEPHVMRH